MQVDRVYWETVCFISFLSATHPDEQKRAQVCQDVLHHAQNDRIEIWTSVWTIVETIRPKQRYLPVDLPEWAKALEQKGKKGELLFPGASKHLAEIWEYCKRHTVSTRMLTQQELDAVRAIFNYPFVRTISIETTIATQASQIARERNMRPGDSIHVASALARKCSCIHRWDRDYKRSDELIPSKEPEWMS